MSKPTWAYPCWGPDAGPDPTAGRKGKERTGAMTPWSRKPNGGLNRDLLICLGIQEEWRSETERGRERGKLWFVALGYNLLHPSIWDAICPSKNTKVKCHPTPKFGEEHLNSEEDLSEYVVNWVPHFEGGWGAKLWGGLDVMVKMWENERWAHQLRTGVIKNQTDSLCSKWFSNH